ncbi:MAG TPA: aminoglycoside phosphotransferase, partial [Anaerolineae bacterium]
MTKGPLIGEGRTAEVYAWGDHQILKLYRRDMPNDWVEYEAKVGRMVCEAGLAAPAIGDAATGDIVKDGDRLGIIYERIDGLTM